MPKQFDVGPENIEGLQEPAFLRYIDQQVAAPIEPDDEDLDKSANPTTVKEQANEYRLAQARKLLRLYRQWKATQY